MTEALYSSEGQDRRRSGAKIRSATQEISKMVSQTQICFRTLCFGLTLSILNPQDTSLITIQRKILSQTMCIVRLVYENAVTQDCRGKQGF